MGDMLSQAEINALLGEALGNAGEPSDPSTDESSNDDSVFDSSIFEEDSLEDVLSSEQKDILGEIGNISMGTSATTLFALLGHKVMITTPRVHVTTWKKLSEGYVRPSVGIRVGYKEGLKGENVLILKQSDVKIISNLMMGGDGQIGVDEEINDLDLSAIGEAMNQMVGSSSTSLSSMLKQKIDIDTPHAFILDFTDESVFDAIGYDPDSVLVCISFKMEVENFINSEIMQVLPKDFAIEMAETLKNNMLSPSAPQTSAKEEPKQAVQPLPQNQETAYQQSAPPPVAAEYSQQTMPMPDPMAQQAMYQQQPYGYPPQAQPQYQQQAYQIPPYQPQTTPPVQPNVNVQPVQFQSFDVGSVMQQKENIEIIMDVPLEITVELGRTKKKIKEILEFSQGTIISLDRLSGDPIDILVNGKYFAKGEVVVIDENFGIRITDIIEPENRI